MSIYKDKPTGQWRFDFDRRVNGARVRRRQLLPAGWTRAQADAFDRKESAALYAIASGIAKPRHTVGQAVELYLKERAPALKAGANARREIEGMADWYEDRPIEELPEVCAEYAADQHGALAPATIKNRIAYLRAACRWAWKRHGLGEHDPGERVVAPEVRNARTVTITRAEVLRLARTCRHRGVRALILVLYYSGMRVSEAQRADRRDGCFVLADTKNGEPRVIPIHPAARVAAGVPMPLRSEIDYWWPLAREACGLQHVRLHDLRHTAATEMVNAGEDLATVGKVLGHKSPASTQRYSHHSTARQAVAVGKIGRRVA
ncbi:MAG TPA: site-specific integrase [Burkholderiaceae bacterium]